jgi:hypothetical protein
VRPRTAETFKLQNLKNNFSFHEPRDGKETARTKMQAMHPPISEIIFVRTTPHSKTFVQILVSFSSLFCSLPTQLHNLNKSLSYYTHMHRILFAPVKPCTSDKGAMI